MQPTHRFDVDAVVQSSRVWYHLCVHPSDDNPATLAALPTLTSSWSAGAVSRQLRAWRLQEWANRRAKHLDYTVDFDVEEFVTRYSPLGCQDGRDGIQFWMLQRGWSNGELVIGHDRIWMREAAWWDAESQLDLKPEDRSQPLIHQPHLDPFATPGATGPGGYPAAATTAVPMLTGPLAATTAATAATAGGAVPAITSMESGGYFNTAPALIPPLGEPGTSIIDNGQGLFPPPQQRAEAMSLLGEGRDLGGSGSNLPPPSVIAARQKPSGDYGLGVKGDQKRYEDADVARWMGELDPEIATPTSLEKKEIPRSRSIWVACVWAVTCWIPSPLLRYIGQMKRPDVRLAWREKFVLFLLIILANAAVIFYIVGLDYILCPNRRKVWSVDEVSQRDTEHKFWVTMHGKVYDVTDWWRVQHSDVPGRETTADVMMPLAGLDLTQYFMPPWQLACPGLVGKNDYPQILNNATRVPNDHPEADHTSGRNGPANSKLHDDDWYTRYYQPKIKHFYKGNIVIKKKDIVNDAQNNNGYMYIMDGTDVFDLTSYFYTNSRSNGAGTSDFIPSSI
ncbi:hypothetical protein KEM52_003212, partial [Ascosphaera acerosa]